MTCQHDADGTSESTFTLQRCIQLCCAVHRQRTQNSSSGESFMDGIILDRDRRHRYTNSSSDGTVATVGSYSGSEWDRQLLATDSNLASSFPHTLKV